MYQSIPIDDVVPAEDNVRHKLGAVKELAASIASVGVIEPLLVSPSENGRFTVVAGHRRLAAAREAGLTEVPCIVKELTEVERLETMIAENLARQALNPLEPGGIASDATFAQREEPRPAGLSGPGFSRSARRDVPMLPALTWVSNHIVTSNATMLG